MTSMLLLLVLLVVSGNCQAADPPQLNTASEKISYSIGYQVGTDLREQGVAINIEALVQGLRDARQVSGPTLLSPEEMRAVLMEFKQQIVASEGKSQQLTAEAYRGEGRAFLAENAKKRGVVSLPSGLQYEVLAEGSGKSPKPEDTVTVNYRGTLPDGKEFDSSFRDGTPATFRVNTVIAGWQEALALMQEGAKWRLFLPADLAFGEKGPLAERVVIYELELLAVQPGNEK